MTEVQALIDELAGADDTYQEADDRVAARGETRLHQLESVYDRFQELLRTYKEPASGSGRETFESYIEFEGELDDFIDSIPPDLIERETLTAAAETLDKRRLTESDFDHAAATLTPVEDHLDTLTARTNALDRYRSVRRQALNRLRETESRIDQLTSILTFETVDFQLPVEDLRSPITEYNTSVTAAFDEFLSDAPARDVLSFIETTTAFPLVKFRRPPDALKTYLMSSPVGDTSIPTLITYTDYTRSKLDHFVPDPATFDATVTANRTYLDRLSAGPVTIEWPPPPADEFDWRLNELIKVVDRFAPSETVASLHDIRALVRDRDRFGSLRETAVAQDTLTAEERAKLESGEIRTTLEEAITEREQLTEALNTYPER